MGQKWHQSGASSSSVRPDCAPTPFSPSRQRAEKRKVVAARLYPNHTTHTHSYAVCGSSSIVMNNGVQGKNSTTKSNGSTHQKHCPASAATPQPLQCIRCIMSARQTYYTARPYTVMTGATDTPSTPPPPPNRQWTRAAPWPLCMVHHDVFLAMLDVLAWSAAEGSRARRQGPAPKTVASGDGRVVRGSKGSRLWSRSATARRRRCGGGAAAAAGAKKAKPGCVERGKQSPSTKHFSCPWQDAAGRLALVAREQNAWARPAGGQQHHKHHTPPS